jgi:uncharacterized protein (TIGR02186 family)
MTGAARKWRGGPAAAAVTAAVVLFTAVAAAPARAERIIASLSSHRVEITSNFSGVELVLFGAIENDAATEPLRRPYDIVATVTGPRQELVTFRKERMFGIWVNADSRTFTDVPSYLAVLSTRSPADIADAETLRRQQVGIANVAFAQSGPGGARAVAADPFRRAFLRIKRERALYLETTNAVTFLTPTLYRASIILPAETPIGNYAVDVKLFADGGMIARTDSAFEIVTVGFEAFIAATAVDHGLLYGLATAAMAVMTGWFAAIVFRRD